MHAVVHSTYGNASASETSLFTNTPNFDAIRARELLLSLPLPTHANYQYTREMANGLLGVDLPRTHNIVPLYESPPTQLHDNFECVCVDKNNSRFCLTRVHVEIATICAFQAFQL